MDEFNSKYRNYMEALTPFVNETVINRIPENVYRIFKEADIQLMNLFTRSGYTDGDTFEQFNFIRQQINNMYH